MTHDELLKKVDEEVSNCLGLMGGAILGDALTAVIKLHAEYDGVRGLSCLECSRYQDIPYPCETLQAIEKELNEWDH